MTREGTMLCYHVTSTGQSSPIYTHVENIPLCGFCGFRLSEVGLSEISKSRAHCGGQFYTDWLPTVGS